MSNTGQIKRYNHVGNDHDGIESDDDGEFVKYDDHLDVVNPLKSYVPTANKLIFDLEKMLKSTESSLIYSSGRAEKLTRELTAAEQRIAELEKIIEVANDRISILEGDVKYMTQECEKAKNINYDDYSTLRQLDELVNYRHIILTAKE